MAAGYTHTVGLKADGSVVAVGDNGDGRCNVSSWSGIVQVAAGHNHTVGLKADGSVVAVGSNSYGQCNLYNWDLLPEEPTIIELASFTARPSRNAVILEWATASEFKNTGFNIYHSEAEDGEYIKINDALIPAKGSPTQGASYEFIDSDVHNRTTYFYKLEDIDLDGNSTMHSPVSATPKWILGIIK